MPNRNALDVAQQIQSDLQSRRWGGVGGNDPVFGTNSVIITAALSDAAAARVRPPVALIRILEATHDPQEPRLVTQDYEVIYLVRHRGDQHGEAAIVGGHKTGGTGGSQGRGILEVEEEVYATLVQLDRSDSMSLSLKAASAVEAAYVEDLGYVAWRSITFEAEMTTLT